jgi:glutathione S-transferase
LDVCFVPKADIADYSTIDGIPNCACHWTIDHRFNVMCLGARMLQLYGNPRSRAMRCLWMLEEMGQPYQLIEKSTRADDIQSVEYRRLNPNARIPTLVDGELVLWESMAINLYLAQKYEGPMHCDGPEALGLAAQWSFWAMLEVEALLLDLLWHRAVLPEFARDASCAERDELLLKKPLGVLNDGLARAIIWWAIALPSPISTSLAFSCGARWAG